VRHFGIKGPAVKFVKILNVEPLLRIEISQLPCPRKEKIAEASPAGYTRDV